MGLRSLAATLGAILVTSGAQAVTPSALRTCNASVLPDCETLLRAPLDARGTSGLGVPKDGGIIYNGASSWKIGPIERPQILSANEQTFKTLIKAAPARTSKAQTTADRVRKQAIDFLKSKSPESAERAALIARLSSMKINSASQLDETCGSETLPGYPNTSYSALENTLHICVAATNVTETQLIRALTHEMGHVISPCVAQSKIYSLDESRLASAELGQCDESFSKFDENGQLREELNPTVSQILDYRPKQMVVTKPNRDIAKLAGCGILKEEPKLTTATYETFSETASCLETQFQSSFENSDEFRAALVENGLSKAKARAQLGATHSAICQADFEEAFADRFGASLLGHISHSWTLVDFQIAALPFAAMTCSEDQGRPLLMSQYEPAKTRLTTLFSEPSISERINCRAAPTPPTCPLRFSAPNSKAAAKDGAKLTPQNTNRSVR